ncbi:MAG: hypothetical protein KGP28_12835 [Bdellovibrionales bacterium]|nr:hypothetical protein [Bdellovibrionales bacterium]
MNMMILFGTLFASAITPVLAAALADGCEIREWNNKDGFSSYYRVSSRGRTVYWRKESEEGLHRNYGNFDRDGLITLSDAAKTCSDRGLTLPTKEDYLALLDCFQEKAYKKTPSGHHKFLESFSDRCFWSSSIHPADAGSVAYFFNGMDHQMDQGFIGNPHFVRCVWKRKK